MEGVRAAIKVALANGVTPTDILDEVAVQSSYNHCPRIIGLGLTCVGSKTSIVGIKISSCTAHEIVYVDQRWCTGRKFFSYCFEIDWAARLETFLRKCGPRPVIISRHGANRDKLLLAKAFEQAGIFASPVVAGCSSVAQNHAFPEDVDEIPSFLNVLGITPQKLVEAAR